MSHSQNNLRRTPSVKREMLTFTTTLERPRDLNRGQMQDLINSAVAKAMYDAGYTQSIVVTKLHKAETLYGDE
ncbi:MAG: hypothetical protein ACKOX6_00775 [Bdellovibrio sp.]